MTHARGVLLLLSLLTPTVSCRETPEARAAELRGVQRTRKHQLEQRLAKADANPGKAAPVAMWYLPSELKEISGLALTKDGRLLTHDDNVGRIYEIDPKSGIVLNEFTLGIGVQGDFESIAIANDEIFLLNSNGVLYRFKEGKEGAGVPFTFVDLRLGRACEFESMAYQADSAWLVMPCKRSTDKKTQDNLVIYRWRLQGPDSARLSTMNVPLAEITSRTGWKGFHPSDMTIDPETGNYVIISSHENGLVEMTPAGVVERAQRLPGDHGQPEGVAITKDRILIISDEATKKPASITLYRWRP
ncbi:MAG: hypothetical protein ABR582_02220 [Gemmatimonadaceae bacterium]